MDLPSTSSEVDQPQSSNEPNIDVANKEAQQTENLQKQLKMLQAEEKGLNSILLELRSQSRKLNLEKYRLLELCKEKQEVEDQQQEESESQQSSSMKFETFSLFN